jgi:hypothetical protein
MVAHAGQVPQFSRGTLVLCGAKAGREGRFYHILVIDVTDRRFTEVRYILRPASEEQGSPALARIR